MEDNKKQTSSFRPGVAILTSIEEYDIKVRSDADNYAKESQETSEAMRQEAQETLNKADAVKAAIEQERQDALESAYKEGFQKGLDDATQQVHDDTTTMLNNIHNLLVAIEALKAKQIQENEKEIVRLSLVLARIVLIDEIKSHPNISLNRIKALVKQIENVGKVKIKINPLEYDFIKTHKHEIEKYVDDDQAIAIKVDDAVPVGSPIIETDSFEIDSAFTKQFEILEHELAHVFDQRMHTHKKVVDQQTEEKLHTQAEVVDQQTEEKKE